MSGFGPPPGAPAEDSRRRPPSYLPPGGLASAHASPLPAPGMPGEALRNAHAAPGADVSSTAYRRGPSVQRGPGRPLMATAHRPGIIPLRPLSVGDLLDGAVKHFRRNPGAVAGLALLVLSVGVIPSVLLSGVALSGSWYSALGLASVIDAAAFSSLLLVLGVGFAALVLCGMLAHSVAEATLGRRPQLPQLWAAARPRLLPLIGLALIIIAGLGVPVLLLILVVAIVADGPFAAVAAVGLLGGLAVLAWSSFVLARTVLAGPALVLENRGVRASLRRAWALSSGSFWRLAGTAFVVGALSLIVYFVVQLPLTLIGSLLMLLVDLTPTVDAVVGALIINIATLLAASVVVPFIAGANTLLYIDQRMRKEGFDLVLLRAASSGSGRRR